MKNTVHDCMLRMKYIQENISIRYTHVCTFNTQKICSEDDGIRKMK